MEFDNSFECDYGVMEDLTPLIRRVVANNPSPFTFKGTGTYIIGRGKVAVIDPGPEDSRHVDAILLGLEGEEITHQLITHTHIDHSPAAKLLGKQSGAKTYGFGPHAVGKYAMGVKVEAGGDADFVPDIKIKDGDIISGPGWTIECLHTPGHTSNHLCFYLKEENALFSGDHVMGWSTTVVSPPDGNMAEYISSLKMLADRNDQVYYPTHGAPITNPQQFVRAIVFHRKLREKQILECLDKGDTTIMAMATIMYKGIDRRLIGAAQHSIFAHIIDLAERGVIETNSKQVSMKAEYHRVR